MKKNLIALAVAGALAAPAAAMADATVFGQVNLSYGSVDNGTTDNIQLRSHASRLGVKGSEDLGGGLSANYHLEWEVNPDSDNVNVLETTGGGTISTVLDGGTAGLKRRNQWVGLKGGFGEMRFGRHDTPLKMSQGKFDQFNDLDGDIGKTFGGEERVDNVVAYLNNFGAIGVAAAIIPGEGSGDSTANGGDGAGDSFADAYSLAATYSAGPLYLAAAYNAYDDTDPLAIETRTRLTGTYKFGEMDFGAMYQMDGGDTAEDRNGYGLSWKMGLAGGNAIKAQYLYNEEDGAPNREWTSMSVGFDHAFSKATKVYAVYTSNETESDNVAQEAEFDFFGVGMLMKF